MSQPLRVLQVIGKMDRAGAETLLMNLYRNIDRERIQFDFLTHRTEIGDYDAEITALGGRIYPLCPMSLKNGLRYQRQLKAFFREHPQYQVVHSHVDAMSALPLLGARRAGVPIRIAHSHNTAFPKDATYPLRFLARQLLSFQATHFFSCSDEAARFLFPKGVIRSGSYTVLANAIELDQFAFSAQLRESKRATLGIGPKTVAVGHVGRFCAQKNHERVVRLFAQFREKQDDSALFLVGQGERRDKIFALCAMLGIESSVHFLGVRDDVSELMQAFDLFLLPSFYEGFPVVGVEAQAAGLPCLLSDQIKKDIALTDSVAFVPLEADDAHWVEAMQALSQHPRKNTTEQLAAQGFDIKRQAAVLEHFYLHAVESR